MPIPPGRALFQTRPCLIITTFPALHTIVGQKARALQAGWVALLTLAFFVYELVLLVTFDFAGLFLEDWFLVVFEGVVFDGAESSEGEA